MLRALKAGRLLLLLVGGWCLLLWLLASLSNSCLLLLLLPISLGTCSLLLWLDARHLCHLLCMLLQCRSSAAMPLARTCTALLAALAVTACSRQPGSWPASSCNGLSPTPGLIAAHHGNTCCCNAAGNAVRVCKGRPPGSAPCDALTRRVLLAQLNASSAVQGLRRVWIKQ